MEEYYNSNKSLQRKLNESEIRLRNSNCVIKLTVGWYYVNFGLELFDPKNPNHEGISEVEIFEKKGSIGKKINTPASQY